MFFSEIVVQFTAGYYINGVQNFFQPASNSIPLLMQYHVNARPSSECGDWKNYSSDEWFISNSKL